MKSIFDLQSKNELLHRIAQLSENSQPQWGKMTVGQMLWHCQFPLKIGIKNKNYRKSGNLFAKLFFKKSLYNDKPWRKNLPTVKIAKTIDLKEFAMEKLLLEQLIEDMHLTKDRTEWNPHPIFGTFTHEQWAQLEDKHLDHHLNQFGV